MSVGGVTARAKLRSSACSDGCQSGSCNSQLFQGAEAGLLLKRLQPGSCQPLSMALLIIHQQQRLQVQSTLSCKLSLTWRFCLYCSGGARVIDHSSRTGSDISSSHLQYSRVYQEPKPISITAAGIQEQKVAVYRWMIDRSSAWWDCYSG